MTREELKTLMEAFNLLMEARIDGLQGNQLIPAGAVIADYRALCQKYAEQLQQQEGGDDEIADE